MRQRLDRRRRGVEVARAMVRDDDPGDAVLDRQRGVRREVPSRGV